MINPALYHKTVDILVQAYFNDTLEHGNCHACAVGNLVAANTGIGFTRIGFNGNMWSDNTPEWGFVFMSQISHGVNQQIINPHRYIGEAKRQIDSTGYTWQQLAKIEYAFETAPKGKSDDEWMFNGLMAVIDVLDEIHENKDEAVTKDIKGKFIKPNSLSLSASR